MGHEQRPAVGREGQPADVVRRQRSDRLDRPACGSTTASRPPKASATTSREPPGIAAISRGLNGRSRLAGERRARAWRPPAPGRQADERQASRPGRGHDGRRAAGRTTTRTGSGATAIRPTTRVDRSRCSINRSSLDRRSTASRWRPSGRTARSARPRPTSCSATTRPVAVSTTERLPLRRWPRAGSCPRRRWPARPAGGPGGRRAGRAGLARGGPSGRGQQERGEADRPERREDRRRSHRFTSAWWRIVTAASTAGSTASRRHSRPP